MQKAYSTMKLPFTQSNMEVFVSNSISGKEKLRPFRQDISKIEKSNKWTHKSLEDLWIYLFINFKFIFESKE